MDIYCLKKQPVALMFGRHAVLSNIVSVLLTVIFLRNPILMGTEEVRWGVMVVMCNTIAHSNQQSSSASRAMLCSYKRGNDDRSQRYNSFIRSGENAIP